MRVTMPGRPLALTPRDRQLLSEVQRCGVLTRDHVIRLRLFRSKTRANERLRRLTLAGYLASRPQPLIVGGPRFVYFPGRLLATTSNSHRRFVDTSDLFLAHELGLVDIRLAFESSTTVNRWVPSWELRPMSLGLVPDVLVEYMVDGLIYCAFIEYDRGTESLARIERKASAYVDLALSGRFERTFRRRYFRALFIADEPGRLSTLSQAIASVTDRVVRLTRLPTLTASGVTAPIWQRPGSTDFQTLTDP
jgi:hypothetical protein